MHSPGYEVGRTNTSILANYQSIGIECVHIGGQHIFECLPHTSNSMHEGGWYAWASNA